MNYPHQDINNRLEEIRNEVFNIIEKSKPLVKGILKERITNYLNNKTAIPETFLEFFEDYITRSKDRINVNTGKKISVTTLTNYKRTFNLLKEFNEKVMKIDFDNIDILFYEKFTAYLQKEYGFSGNTIGKHIKIIKTVLNNAVEKGVNKNFAYKSKQFKIIKEETEAVYLNEQELKQISDLDLSANKRLEKARDLFIIGCYTGLRYSDYSRLTKNDIVEFDGKEMFKIRTKKTDTPILIPILPQVKKILDKYDTLPKISNQKLNSYIKEVCKLVPDLNKTITKTETKNGLRVTKKVEKYKLITTHTARRSFATNMYKRGIPANVIMAITGHKTEKMFLKYIRATQNEKVIDFVRAFEQTNKLEVVSYGK